MANHLRAALAAAVLIALVLTARAQEHQHRPGDTHFYSQWMIPPVRTNSCCNNSDCAPTEIVRQNGKWYARNHFLRPGQDIEIPDAILEHNQGDPRESPDEQSHVCIHPGSGSVLCAVLGSGT